MINQRESIPKQAWKRRFSERLTRPGKPSRSLTPKMLLSMLLLILRLRRKLRAQKNEGFDPINLFNPPQPGPVMGVPLGGIGGGSITRGWQGDFRRWQLRPGFYSHQVVFADQFSLYVQRKGEVPQAQVLYPSHPEGIALSKWKWDMDPICATYYALFPRAWTIYDEPLPGVRLTCRQIFPVIAHNYKESSYPVAVFQWKIDNIGKQSATVGLMFTFQNGMGTPNDLTGGHVNQPFCYEEEDSSIVGVVMRYAYQQIRTYKFDDTPGEGQEVFKDPLTFAMATIVSPQVEVTYCSRFSVTGDGAGIWEDFSADGKLDNREDFSISEKGETIGAALVATASIRPGKSTEIIFSLAWDMPLVHSGYGSTYYRWYTSFFGTKGDAAPRIAQEALLKYPQWEGQIVKWQKPILKDPKLPDWYKMALFNELYYIVDGGTLWACPAEQAGFSSNKEIGHFAYLEGHEYRMYNTYDVHFYASFALAQCWPELESSLQRDIAKATLLEYPDMVTMLFNGKPGRRKLFGMVPHDAGWPEEDFWKMVNGYYFHDVNEWKDLNPKFVLQVYRDYVITKDKRFLKDVWLSVEKAIEKASHFDRDHDGLIENDGIPDQTYDTWSVSGASAYTGGLWLACLLAAIEMARKLGKFQLAQKYLNWFTVGQAAYEAKLWNGLYYDYDSSRSQHHDSIMADMLAGQWYAKACGLIDILPHDHIKKALQTIYEFNIRCFQNSEMGAVNGMRPNGKVDQTNLQSQEVWTGTSYALAASFMQEGLEKACWQTAHGIVKTTYKDRGYWFQTPEAWDKNGDFRSLAYMRPLSIWAIQWAVRNWKKQRYNRNKKKRPINIYRHH